MEKKEQNKESEIEEKEPVGRDLIEDSTGSFYKSVEDMSDFTIYEALKFKAEKVRALFDVLSSIDYGGINAEDSMPCLACDGLEDADLVLKMVNVLFNRHYPQPIHKQ